ncbi:DDE-type integrase/transposase/recombinase, partial [Endozoicomonas arenosclerae]|uniref:DDE-type integrase/transposase/recombinase n=1 Tax=Endozoicomonas arenosclerae TaxID=1633495 RepID=UPI000ACF54D9
NLRQSHTYQTVRRKKNGTRSVQRAIGVRRRPDPQGRPGFIRVDTVHQGDKDGVKGLYHINAVDEVTQFEVVCSVERISETFMISVLEEILATFPFKLLAFHSDNGSEYINHKVAKLLNKLHIALTKSRSRHSNDNALVESKNGSVIRKILGYAHIPQQFAVLVNRFDREYLNPYLNYHRPCFFPDVYVDKKGKERKRYRYEDMMTPYEKFVSLQDAQQYLKSGVTLKSLEAKAHVMTDNEAARRLQNARENLLTVIYERPA